MKAISFEKEIEQVKKWAWPRYSGKVTHVIGMLIESIGPEAYLGEICIVYGRHGEKVPCQVVGFKEQKTLLMALSDMSHVALGAEVFPTGGAHQIAMADSLCGRVLDALGNPLDGKGPLEIDHYYSVAAKPPAALERKRIAEVFPTGIKAIDAFLTLGKGQRMGIFSTAGVGKSTLMGMLARNAKADINVIALIGERGREVKEFVEKDLGKEGLERSVIVVSTADQMATLRSKGASVACAIAEYFRDKGKHVLLLMDSLTRYTTALREIGLAIGEPITTKGHPPSLFSHLPFLLERAGNSSKGSITGIYTILEDGEDTLDPISEYIRSLLDGHIVLSKKMSIAHNFPPIDILKSLSRVMGDIVTKDHLKQAGAIRELLQAYQETEELIEVGAYVSGTNPIVDKAREKKDKITQFLRQNAHFFHPYEKTLRDLSLLL